MNCDDFRYLVQRRFDVELSPQDDRALLIHLETCESCQRFYHQVQQVIIAAEELDLTEDLLPPNPELLLAGILNYTPQEKAGLGGLITSFLKHLGFYRNTKTEESNSGLLPPSDKVKNRLSTPGKIQTANAFENVIATKEPALSSTSWGSESSKAEEFLAQSPALEEQVITRSLGQKFGISGANSHLSAKPALSLAESIKQKISEMSKSNMEIQSAGSDLEMPATEPIDEWTVPHSPQWPKLNADINPEQWPDEADNRAPNAWGSHMNSWDSANPPFSDNANLTSQAPAFQAKTDNLPTEIPQNKSPLWSPEAEQLETGNWQAIEFNTTLGAAGYSSSETLSAPPQPNIDLSSPVPDFPEIAAELANNVVTPNIVTPIEQVPQFEEVAQAEQFVQSEEVTQPEQIVSIEQVQVQENLASGPKIYPVISKHAKTQVEATQDKPTIAQPIVRPAEIVAPVSAASPISNAAQDKIQSSATDNDNSPLFALDDTAIDKLFSNNLGIHEKAVLARSSANQPQNAALPKQPILNSATPNIPVTSPPISQAIAQSSLPISTPAIPNNPATINPTTTKPTTTKPMTAKPEATKPETTKPQVNNPAVTDKPVTFPPPSFSAPNPLAKSTFARPQTMPALKITSASPEPQIDKPEIPVANNTVVPEAAEKNEPQTAGLFTVDDNMIDRIFTDTLGVPEHISKNAVSHPVDEVHEKSATQPQSKENDFSPPPSPPVIKAPPLSTPKTNITNIPTASVPPAVSIVPPVASNLPPAMPMQGLSNASPFGEPVASGYSSGKEKIVGVGRLDNRNETIADPGSGRIASIGKFLLDNKDLEKIGKLTASDLSDSKMRTLTLEANEELKNLLRQIDAQEGVTGTVIVGHDGLLIANTMPQDTDPESLGVCALAVFMGTAHVVEKLGDDNVRQIVSQTNQGYLIIANFGAGLLVTLTNPIMLDKLLPLMRTITQLVAA